MNNKAKHALRVPRALTFAWLALSLTAAAEKLNADRGTVFAKADEATTQANDYFRSLKARS